MNKEMREQMNKFKNLLKESSNEKLNQSDIIDSDFFYNELKRCIDDSYERDFGEEEYRLNEYKLIESIKEVIKNLL